MGAEAGLVPAVSPRTTSTATSASATVAATHARCAGVVGTVLVIDADVLSSPAFVAALTRTACAARCAFQAPRCPWKGADRGRTGREGKSEQKSRSESERHGRFLTFLECASLPLSMSGRYANQLPTEALRRTFPTVEPAAVTVCGAEANGASPAPARQTGELTHDPE